MVSSSIKMGALPPSPALSACDSLAGIEDLDAFLEAQGALSHFPTPPPADEKQTTIVTEVDECEDDMDCEDGQEPPWAHDIAQKFSEKVNIGVIPDPIDTFLILGVLRRSRMPAEVIALAFNILKSVERDGKVLPLYHQAAAEDEDFEIEAETWTLAALGIAALCIFDGAPTWRHWAKHVARGAYTARQIDITAMKLNILLDWRTHSLSTSEMMQDALAELYPPDEEPEVSTEQSTSEEAEPLYKLAKPPLRHNHEVPAPLKLVLANTSSHCVNGEITPLDTPHESPGLPEGQFLRLL